MHLIYFAAGPDMKPQIKADTAEDLRDQIGFYQNAGVAQGLEVYGPYPEEFVTKIMDTVVRHQGRDKLVLAAEIRRMLTSHKPINK